jgi:hypothetical protein
MRTFIYIEFQKSQIPVIYIPLQSALVSQFSYSGLFFNCCFIVHFDKYKIILPTNALFIKNTKFYNVYLTPTCFGPSWTIIREYTFVPR